MKLAVYALIGLAIFGALAAGDPPKKQYQSGYQQYPQQQLVVAQPQYTAGLRPQTVGLSQEAMDYLRQQTEGQQAILLELRGLRQEMVALRADIAAALAEPAPPANPPAEMPAPVRPPPKQMPAPQQGSPAKPKGGATTALGLPSGSVLFQKHCAGCHSMSVAEVKGKGQYLFNEQGIPALDAELAQTCSQLIGAGKMPKGRPLPPEERANLVQWLQQVK